MNRLIILLLIGALAVTAYLFIWQKSDRVVLPVEVEAVPALSQKQNRRVSYEKFSVELPETPHHTEFNSKDPLTEQMRHYEMYVTELPDDSLYMINLVTYLPSDVQDSEKVFRNFIEEMVASNPRNQVVSATPTQFQNLAAMNFAIQNDESTLLNTIFLKENILYVLTRQTKLSAPNAGEFEQFIASFKFQPE
jgi:hypothetical protein